MTLLLFCCETCGTLTEVDSRIAPADHDGHLASIIEGGDRDTLWATGAKHLQLAARMNSGGPFGLKTLRA